MAFTYFFRDNTVLETAADLFVKQTMGRSRVRIWDAGCAMGPEPYTLLIMLCERMGKFSFENLRLDATDHDESGDFGEIIERGHYPADAVNRIPKVFLEKYFKCINNGQNMYEISPTLRSKLFFKRHDLLTLFPAGDGYAMIVCKNVLLHFTEKQRIDVISMFYNALAPEGLLVMEHTQKMPEHFHSMFNQVSTDTQIYTKSGAISIAA